jgi:hypothetical protein
MASKTTSCFTSIKEALLIHAQNPKIVTLVLLLLVTSFLVSLDHVMSNRPLTGDMASAGASHLIEIKNTGPFSAGYARLLNEIKQDVLKLVIISIALQVVMPAFSFLKQIIAFTIYFADRYSLTRIIPKLVKVNSLKDPSITLALVALLVALLSAVIRRRLGVLSIQGLVFLLAFLVFLIEIV